MAGFTINYNLCSICHAPIEMPSSPCKKCGKYFHKSGSCALIHSRSCGVKVDPRIEEDIYKRSPQPFKHQNNSLFK